MKEIQLTQGRVAIVDNDWHPILMQWKWHYLSKGYAVRKAATPKGQVNVYMHRYITSACSPRVVDHINRNKLDNRYNNLRIATPQQNCFNSKVQINNKSGYKGVSFDAKRNKYVAAVQFNKKQKTIGRYDSAKEAALAYDKQARIFFGEFAFLNFPGMLSEVK